VRLNPVQYHHGATFFVSTTCVRELHDLMADERALHLEEMALMAEALCRCVRPAKMNYEALGNTVPHLHWWLTPRHDDDPQPRGPIWEDPGFQTAMRSGARIPDEDRHRLRRQLLAELRLTGVAIERSFV
jgi:diadenosine tetraphosphate (Ap4A) HIT family hydrolase